MDKNSFRTFIYKIGDSQADSAIQKILCQGWKVSAVTPNGSVRITTFCRDLNSVSGRRHASSIK